MGDFRLKGAVASPTAKTDGLSHPDSNVVFERAKSVTIGVLAVTLGVVAFAQFAKPVRPSAQDTTSVTLAPRSPM